MKSDSKYIYNVNKDFYLTSLLLFFYKIILNKGIMVNTKIKINDF